MTVLEKIRQRSAALVFPEPVVCGRLTRMVGLTLEAIGCKVVVGGYCRIVAVSGEEIQAEVVGFSGDRILLMPIGDVGGLMPGALVIPDQKRACFPAGAALLGRVLDGRGMPLDGLPPVSMATAAEGELSYVPLTGRHLNPLRRLSVRSALDVGVRAINSLLTVGKGQRMGLFAGSGVGKSVLLGMMTKNTVADITIVGLIGERGREVKEFIDDILGTEGMRRSVVVASPADDPPLMRLHAAMAATALAEYFRDQGFNVLLLMDSLTRFCQAQREIALAVGEPPATKGYPPSVFARLPQLVERAGNSDCGQGTLTAFYTVLSEGDDQQDPIADAARAILDGHIVLSRQLADEGHYPAIDIEASISRVMPAVVDKPHFLKAQRFKQVWSHYRQNRDLITIGAYAAGSDAETDYALHYMPDILAFLQQGLDDSADMASSISTLTALLGKPQPVIRRQSQ